MSQHGMDEQAKYDYQQIADKAPGRMPAQTVGPAPSTDLQQLYSMLQNEIDVLHKITSELRNQCDQAYGEEMGTETDAAEPSPAVDCGGSVGALFQLMAVLVRHNELLQGQVSRLHRL